MFVTKILPFGDERQRSIRAMSNADLRKRTSAPVGDRSKHGINLSLKLGGPPPGQLGGGVEVGLEVEDGVKRGVLEGAKPGLADGHGASPSVLQGEAREDVDEALVSQLGPVDSGS